MKRLVLLLLLTGCSVQAGCSGGSKVVHTMTGAFATCMAGDLGQIVTSGLPLLSDVSLKIEANGPTLEADLVALAKLVGIDAVKCAIAAVEAVVIPQPAGAGSGSGSAAIKLASKPPGLERALVWSKAQK